MISPLRPCIYSGGYMPLYHLCTGGVLYIFQNYCLKDDEFLIILVALLFPVKLHSQKPFEPLSRLPNGCIILTRCHELHILSLLLTLPLVRYLSTKITSDTPMDPFYIDVHHVEFRWCCLVYRGVALHQVFII